MENKAQGGFVLRDRDGRPVVGQLNCRLDGTIDKQEVDHLTIEPDQRILDDMVDKGLWGSYLFANNQMDNDQVMSR